MLIKTYSRTSVDSVAINYCWFHFCLYSQKCSSSRLSLNLTVFYKNRVVVCFLITTKPFDASYKLVSCAIFLPKTDQLEICEFDQFYVVVSERFSLTCRALQVNIFLSKALNCWVVSQHDNSITRNEPIFRNLSTGRDTTQIGIFGIFSWMVLCNWECVIAYVFQMFKELITAHLSWLIAFLLR